jgi:hypothetical protein
MRASSMSRETLPSKNPTPLQQTQHHCGLLGIDVSYRVLGLIACVLYSVSFSTIYLSISRRSHESSNATSPSNCPDVQIILNIIHVECLDTFRERTTISNAEADSIIVAQRECALSQADTYSSALDHNSFTDLVSSHQKFQ